MGVYNTYGDKINAQMKVADNLGLTHFGIGDVVDIPDGVYVTYEGIIVIREGRIADEFSPDQIFDKWGKPFDLIKTCNLSNPVTAAVEAAKIQLAQEKEENDDS